jgi:hypothetical protein
MERRNLRYFSLMSHPSFVLVQPYIIVLIWNIQFNAHCSQFTTHALALPLIGKSSYKPIKLTNRD